MSLLKRSVTVKATSAPVLAGGEITCRLALPALYEFLTLTEWEPGLTRKPGTVSLFWEDGQFKAWLNDKDGGRSTCVSALSWEELFLRVDQKLTEDSLEWRKARPEQGRAGKK